MKRIVIMGLGGVGGYFGGMLARTYATNREVEVYFVARGKHGLEIARSGLEVETPKGSFRVRPEGVVEQPERLGVTADYILCCTKSYDLEAAVQKLRPIIGPETVIVPLLNGADIRDRIVEQLKDRGQVWYGLTYIVAMKTTPGTVRNVHGRGKLLFGSGQPRCERGDELEALLREAGIQAEWHDDIQLQVWKKFIIISVSAAATSYFDLPVLLALERHAAKCRQLLQEATSVAQARGFDLTEEYCWQELLRTWGSDNKSTTSMHRDFRAGRPTEVDSLCGYIVREAERLGIPVPAYEEIYRGLKVGISK